ncbi:MAG: hypothetical protein ACK5QX_04685 [bacterium]
MKMTKNLRVSLSAGLGILIAGALSFFAITRIDPQVPLINLISMLAALCVVAVVVTLLVDLLIEKWRDAVLVIGPLIVLLVWAGGLSIISSV